MSCSKPHLQGRVYSTRMDSWSDSIERLFRASDLQERVVDVPLILIKPNLVNTSPPPVTTPVALIGEIIRAINAINAETTICIGEGTGSIEYDTHHCFAALGYEMLAKQLNIQLIDLNKSELVLKKNPEFSRWPEMYLPEILDRAFVISVPVLKAHSLAGVTLTMKNMMGCAPPAHYQQGGCWGKSAFHTRIQEAVFELNRYRTPDFTILDATIGMSQSHLWGDHCDPPVGRLVASYDPVAVDSYGCELLGTTWDSIGHIRMADSVLGSALHQIVAV